MSAARDPEGRRLRILRAACAVIAEVGAGSTTHRLVAARAGVPLGATTYYFASLDELVTAALEHVTAELQEDLQGWAERLTNDGDLPGTLASLAGEYVADRSRALVEFELYLAAARRPELRPLALAWIDGVRGFLTAATNARAAAAAVAVLDGAVLQALVTGAPLDEEQLRWSLTRCL